MQQSELLNFSVKLFSCIIFSLFIVLHKCLACTASRDWGGFSSSLLLSHFALCTFTFFFFSTLTVERDEVGAGAAL